MQLDGVEVARRMLAATEAAVTAAQVAGHLMEMVNNGGSYFQSLLPSIMLHVNLKFPHGKNGHGCLSSTWPQ